MNRNRTPWLKPGAILGYTDSGKAIRFIAGGAEDRDKDDDGHSLLPETMEDLKNKTPDEFRTMIDLLDAHLKDLHETDQGELRDLNKEEQEAFDLGVQMREYCLNKLEEHRKVSEIFRRRPESVKRVYNNIRHGVNDDNASVLRMNTAEARDRALRILDNKNNSARLKPEELDQVDREIRSNTDIARRVIVTENEAYRSAWMRMVTNPNAGITLDDEERDALRAFEEYQNVSERTAMGEGTGATGGYGVPVFIDPSIILTAQGSSNPFLQLCRQETVNTNAWKGVSSAGVSWSFQAEAAEVGDNSPTLDQPVVNVNMARGFIPYSIEVGQDYPGFAQQMSNLLSEGYDELLVDKFTNGTGTLEPTGLVTALTADTTVQVHVSSTGNISAEDPYSLWQALPQRYRRNANFLMSVNVNNAFRRLGTADQWHDVTVQLPAAWLDTLFGKGVYEDPYMGDLSNATGAAFAVVGDFSNYLIAKRGGMSVELLPLLIGASHRPTGQRGWFAYARIGGNSINNKGFRLLNNT